MQNSQRGLEESTRQTPGPTNALTVQAIMELGIVQQDSNHMHPPPIGNPANGTGIYKNNSISKSFPPTTLTTKYIHNEHINSHFNG